MNNECISYILQLHDNYKIRNELLIKKTEWLNNAKKLTSE